MKAKPKIIIRPPRMSDLDSLLRMMHSLVEERAMITVQKKLTRRAETEYLKKVINDKKSIHRFLIIDGEVMGNARLSISRHDIGEVGISVRKEARGRGLGEMLLKKTMEDGIRKFNLRIITLTALTMNKIAQGLYEKLGFEKVGVIKGGANHYGKYEDFIIMAMYLK